MSWQVASLLILAVVIGGGFLWFERSRPSARIVAAVAAMAALGVAGRLAFAPIPNVVATTDIVLLAGYTLGGGPGFAVGALSGLVSNFWLGQGPWTPWQMAGWGAIGIAGAVLAKLSGRRLGRLQLALCGAAAGLAYGALLDLSVMVSFGGEQSLDRYLALSARGIPFNIAHAVGNFILMYAAGPAMVRILDRYRERFAFRWSDAPLGRAAVCAIVALCLALPLVSPPTGRAAADKEGAVAWLTSAQNDDGGFGVEPDAASSVGMTGWAMLGLEAAGTNPRDIESTGAVTPVGYLHAHADALSSTADLERTILALEGAGLSARAFEGRDLVSELRERQSADHSFAHQVNLTAFAILAQRAAGVSGSNVGAAAQWLRTIQNRNGGWGSADGADSEPDSTGAVLQALAVAPGGTDQLALGANWLEHAQHGDGGWSLTPSGSSNTQSTAWAVQGLIAAGRSPGAVRKGASSGADFIASLQGSDGRYTYSHAGDQTPVWVTAQGLTAVGEAPFPIPAVDRAPPPDPTPEVDPGSADPPPLDLGGTGTETTGLPGIDSGAGLGSTGGGARAGGGDGAAVTGESEPTGPEDATGRRRLEANPGSDLESFVQSAATAAQLPSQDSPLPSTIIFVGALALLAAGLGTGFLRYRKRHP